MHHDEFHDIEDNEVCKNCKSEALASSLSLLLHVEQGSWVPLSHLLYSSEAI